VSCWNAQDAHRRRFECYAHSFGVCASCERRAGVKIALEGRRLEQFRRISPNLVLLETFPTLSSLAELNLACRAPFAVRCAKSFPFFSHPSLRRRSLPQNALVSPHSFSHDTTHTSRRPTMSQNGSIANAEASSSRPTFAVKVRFPAHPLLPTCGNDELTIGDDTGGTGADAQGRCHQCVLVSPSLPLYRIIVSLPPHRR
jgi:hypothetical protein